MIRAKHLPGRPTRWCRGAAILLCLGLIAPAQGATVSGLYKAEIPVADQSDKARQEAMRAGLEQVLVRVAGSGAAALAGQVDDPGSYLQRYSYTESGGDELVLEVRFDERDVNRLLGEHGHISWGRQRPETLAWIGVESGDERRILSRDSSGPVAEAVRAAARRRGLPFELPLMDAQDPSRVVFGNIRGGFHDRLAKAAERYDPDRVLVAKIDQVGGNAWEARWTLLTGGAQERWRSSVGEVETVVHSGLTELAERYLTRFAATPDEGGQGQAVLVSVEGISNVAACSRVMAYFDSLSPVEGVALRTVATDRLAFRVTLSDSIERFDRVVELGRVLDKAEPDAGGNRRDGPNEPPRLTYTWSGRAG